MVELPTAFWAVLSAAGGYLLKVLVDRSQADFTIHQTKLKDEFSYLRSRLEDVVALAGETRQAYAENCDLWTKYAERRTGVGEVVQFANYGDEPNYPPTPKAPTAKIEQLISFHAPELTSKSEALIVAEEGYFVAMWQVKPGDREALAILDGAFERVASACTDLQDATLAHYKERRDAYLARAIDPVRLTKWLGRRKRHGGELLP